MRTQPRSFSKEKALFLVAALFSAALFYSFMASGPLELRPGSPLTTLRAEPARLAVMPSEPRVESAYFTGERKSPFILRKNEEDDRRHEGTPTVERDPTHPGARVEKQESVPPPEAYYNFAGVVVHQGRAHALLQSRQKGETLRAREGTALEGGYTVARVLKQSIELRYRGGRVFVLRDRPIPQ